MRLLLLSFVLIAYLAGEKAIVWFLGSDLSFSVVYFTVCDWIEKKHKQKFFLNIWQLRDEFLNERYLKHVT